MGKLDLQHAFAGRGALAENFEDQRGTIEHFRARLALKIALLNRRQSRIDKQQFDVVGFYLGGQGFDMTGAEIGRRPNLAHFHDVGENHVQPDCFRKPFKLGLPCLKAMIGRLASDIGTDKPHSCRLFLPVDIGLRAARKAAILVVKIVHMVRQSWSLFCSGSNSWIGAPGMIVEMACL